MYRIFNSIDRTAQAFRPDYQAKLQAEKQRQAAQKMTPKKAPFQGHLQFNLGTLSHSDAAK